MFPAMSEATLKAFSAAIVKILRALVRLSLRSGVSYNTFAELTKWIYVDVAMNEFGIEGRKQSVSRVATLTGLSRKDVVRVQESAPPSDGIIEDQYNRAARVITGWMRERDFLDARGKPRSLPLEGEGATFESLVKRFSGDIPPRAIFDELLRVGAIRQLKDGRVRLVTGGYVPQLSEVDKIHILGSDVSHLIATIGHNLRPGQEQPFFQRKVAYNNLPDEALPKLRNLSAKKSQALLEELDRWLAKHDRDSATGVKGTGRNQAGVGIYYFEEPYKDEE